MPRYTNISLHILRERLGSAGATGQRGGSGNRHTRYLCWQCGEHDGGRCYAQATADDVPMAQGLSAFEQEMYETAPLPEEGWALKPCTKHRDLFRDYPEEAE